MTDLNFRKALFHNVTDTPTSSRNGFPRWKNDLPTDLK